MLPMMTKAEFLAAVEDAVLARKMTATSFGRAAVGDPTFVFELRRGRSCGLDTINRVLAFIRSSGETPESKPGEAA